MPIPQKMTEQQAKQAAGLYEQGKTLVQLAELFKVSPGTVSRRISRYTTVRPRGWTPETAGA